MPGNNLVPIKKQSDLTRKSDQRIPDEVWQILQECGEEAANHLHRILKSPGFEKRKIHEQIRVIELALLRSYGAPELAPKRAETPPERDEEHRRIIGNQLARIAERAVLPELRVREPIKKE
jgi:hypothetical protein